MNLIKEHYDRLYENSIQQIRENNYSIDYQIDSVLDKRFGLTLLIRPDTETKNKIQAFLDELKEIDPNQYYYPNSDIHITVMSIISCYDDFDLTSISIPNYVSLIQKTLYGIADVAIDFTGVTASPSAVMIQGFTNSNVLNNLRNNLRMHFKDSGLEESMDKRYTIQAAHSTVVRFRKPLKNKQKLIEILEKYRNFHFGKFKIQRYYLVYNDWYQREKWVKELHEFQAE
ncbi:mutarotase [Flavobacterium alvei]|uniref:mutarotase n=1 Tax=Flavobacterium alvei TaxID=2080416 RepID=UPI0026EC901A|nr:mutarotase [Flavobacterium alvei]